MRNKCASRSEEDIKKGDLIQPLLSFFFQFYSTGKLPVNSDPLWLNFSVSRLKMIDSALRLLVLSWYLVLLLKRI